MSNISETIDFMAKLKVSKLSSVERVEVLKRFLVDSQNKDKNERHKPARDELRSLLDIAHFESTTPW